MASPPPPLLLLLLPLLLLLLPLPAAPGTRGQPPSPGVAGPAGSPEPGPERELPPPPERHGPAPPGHRQTTPAPGGATQPGPSGQAPGGRSAEANKSSLIHFPTVSTAVKNHWLESNTEQPHTENITFDQNQVDFSTVVSKEDVMVQTPRKSQASSDAPGNFTPQTETAATGSSDSSRRTDFTISPVGPERAAALTSQSSTLALGRRRPPSSSSGSEGRTAPSHTESGTSWGSPARGQGLPEEVTVHTQVAATSVLTQSSLPAVEGGEETTLPRQRNSSGPELSWLPLSRTLAYFPPSDQAASSGSTEDLNDSTAVHSPSVSGTKSVHVATMFPDGVPRMLQSLAISPGPLNGTEHFPEDSEMTTTSASVHSSPSEAGWRRNSGVIRSAGDGALTKPSTENGVGLTSSKVSGELWQNDSPTSRGHQLASSSGAGSGSPVSQTATVSRSVPPARGGESTARLFLTDSEPFADATGSSTSHPEVVNASVLTRFSASAPQSRGSDPAPGERSYSEPATESLSSSSSESLGFWAPRGERSTTEDSPELAVSSEVEEGAPGARAHSPHTWATFTGIGERTLRSLTNGSTTPGDVQRSAATPRDAERPTQRGNVTATWDAHAVSGSLAASRVLGGDGVTGMSYDAVSGTHPEHGTSSDYTDHTYVSAPFTKGERALLSIADHSSSLDVRESSTSSVKISSSLQSDSSSSSQAQAERSNVSSHDGEYAQSSTAALVLRTASPPSRTPAVNMLTTLVLLDTDAESVGDTSLSSSSGAPLPQPSVSQSYRFSSTLPSTRASTHPLQSAPDVPTPLSSSPPPSLVSLTASAPVSPSVSQTILPPSSSTLVLPKARDTPVTSAWTSIMASSVAMLPSSQTADPKNQSSPHLGKLVTESKPQSLETLPVEATETVTVRPPLGISLSLDLTESSTEQTLPATSTSLAQASPALVATTLQTSHPPVPSPQPPSSTASLTGGPTTVQTVAGKQLPPTSPEILVVRISTEGAVTTERSPVNRDAATGSIALTSVPTSAKEWTTGLAPTEEHSLASHFLRTSPSPQSTPVSTAKVLTSTSTTFTAQSSTQSSTAPSSPASVNSCATNPCLHDGKCVVDPTSRGYQCVCSPSWQGDDCHVDVNECLSNPCPPLAMCNNTQGSFTCRCPVGYQLEKGICNLVRTFVTEFKLKKIFLNTTVEKHSDFHEVENEITKTLNVCFSTLPGYTRSTAHASREPSAVVMSLQTTFSLASNVTLFDLADGMQKCVNSCRASAEVCQLLGSQRRIFRAGSLCKRKTPECDKETSICTDLDGVALCQCKSGYFQFNKMDHSCRACEDGYRLENETCMSCPFGLGGLNCGNPYQLITVVIAAAGGGLLLILGIALIVTCCRKNKNDISKLIFKSGDFQMSPYAEYPKNPRSQEWGREAIEMHENGSTKNLLQMTDVYYSPTSVRNPELERNGLYPAYTGLPGSRHSCIFPGQYNPSFISDESRRRDYF
ncbi:protein HEG homolog 1 isoform X2 [Mesoplodon densirostris]|uniref:protein HEG homolog 1 isoform X2 n=1 Tax=Mesoplodon densirostris TaxID=48708 RepID=UPI0028DB04D1|nr:protein HEG homolog 1 isoform X2 [Mesoplodon densirostris]